MFEKWHFEIWRFLFWFFETLPGFVVKKIKINESSIKKLLKPKFGKFWKKLPTQH
jgi:hypothetical protein